MFALTTAKMNTRLEYQNHHECEVIVPGPEESTLAMEVLVRQDTEWLMVPG